MGRFLNGVLIGIGIGLLIAPMKREEMRGLVGERYEELRSKLPDNEQLKQAGQQMTSQLKGDAQQAASQVMATGSSLGDLAQQAAREVKQTGQDVASTTKKAATSLKQGG